MQRWMRLAGAAALTAVAAAARPGAALADARDYEFRLVTPEVKQGDGAIIAVRLVHRPTGRAVPDAVVYGTRLDMGPESMPTMTAPLAPVPGGEPGTYRFRTNLAMAGGWALTLTAKVQGEEGTVQSRLVLRAAP